MAWFSKKRKQQDERERTAYQIPTDAELEQRLRDVDEVNRRIAGDPQLQAVFAALTREEPPPSPPPTLEELHQRAGSGGLSYIMSPPAGFPELAPEAAQLHMEGVFGSVTGDDRESLAKFTEALALTRAIGNKPEEVRLLYNVGVAHHKIGDDEQAIAVLREGKALAESIAEELAREARKLQRAAEEHKLDEPRLEVFGTPDIEQKLLAMFLEALAKVHEALGQTAEAAECRREVDRLYRADA
jgi:tetratricopeptide (TPR) repeat protein